MSVDDSKNSCPSSNTLMPHGDSTESNALEAMATHHIEDIAHDLVNLVSKFRVSLYLTKKTPDRLDERLIGLEYLVNYLDALARKLKTVSQSEPITPAVRLLNLNEVVERVIK